MRIHVIFYIFCAIFAVNCAKGPVLYEVWTNSPYCFDKPIFSWLITQDVCQANVFQADEPMPVTALNSFLAKDFRMNCGENTTDVTVYQSYGGLCVSDVEVKKLPKNICYADSKIAIKVSCPPATPAPTVVPERTDSEFNPWIIGVGAGAFFFLALMLLAALLNYWRNKVPRPAQKEDDEWNHQLVSNQLDDDTVSE